MLSAAPAFRTVDLQNPNGDYQQVIWIQPCYMWHVTSLCAKRHSSTKMSDITWKDVNPAFHDRHDSWFCCGGGCAMLDLFSTSNCPASQASPACPACWGERDASEWGFQQLRKNVATHEMPQLAVSNVALGRQAINNNYSILIYSYIMRLIDSCYIYPSGGFLKQEIRGDPKVMLISILNLTI